MEISARVNSEGEITIPEEIRNALGIKEGDVVRFRIDGGRVMMARTPDLLELAGSFSVPIEKRGTPWDEIIRETWRVRAAERMKAAERR